MCAIFEFDFAQKKVEKNPNQVWNLFCKLESDFFPIFIAIAENSKIAHIYFFWNLSEPIMSKIGAFWGQRFSRGFPYNFFL